MTCSQCGAELAHWESNDSNRCDTCAAKNEGRLRVCGHKSHEDCMTCATCGQCREDLDDDDVCPDCVPVGENGCACGLPDGCDRCRGRSGSKDPAPQMAIAPQIST